MDAHSHRQPVLAAGVAPAFHEVFPRPHVYRVPLLIGAVPQVEVVVMVAQRHEILCAGLLVELHQGLGIPFFSLPMVYQVLQSVGLGRAEMGGVPVPLLCSGVVHEAGVPVAVLGLALRAPVGPHAKLGILEPLRTLPAAHALPCGPERALLHRHSSPGGCAANGLRGRRARQHRLGIARGGGHRKCQSG